MLALYGSCHVETVARGMEGAMLELGVSRLERAQLFLDLELSDEYMRELIEEAFQVIAMSRRIGYDRGSAERHKAEEKQRKGAK